jgi:hypothetical protein
MVRNFDALAEIRRHPGISAGTVAAVLAGAALALYLNQRSGPTRYQRFRQRIDPRGWVDTAALGGRLHDAVDAFRHGAQTFGERAGAYADDARHEADAWYRRTRKGRKRALKTHGRTARRYADDAGAYARDHAKEGGALLAVAALAAVVGAAVLESQRPDSRVRRMTGF